ncbi:MAG: DUF6882 domain-containing protein [Nitrospira sp.]
MGLLNRLFGGWTSSVPPQFQLLIEQSMEDLRAKTAAHEAAWKLGQASWSVDQEAGTIVFTRPDGIAATALVQIIGTYNTQDGTWLWGWANPSLAPTLVDHSSRLRAYGQERGIERLTTRKLVCSEDGAWELTALACKLCDAQGGYRGPAGPTLVFMTFGTVALSGSAKTDGQKAESAENPAPELPLIEAPDVQAFIEAYFAEMFAVERDSQQGGGAGSPSALQKGIERKMEIYERHWRRDDDYWKPCSMGGLGDYDLAQTDQWKIYATGPEVYLVAYRMNRGEIQGRTLYQYYALEVQRFDDGLRIIDFRF